MRSRSAVELRGVPAELLAERERHRVLQVRAPDLHDVGELLCLARRARRASATHGRQRSGARSSCAAAMCIAVGNVSFEDCDMFTWSFGWTGVLRAQLAAGDLDRAVRDHLVRVHVRLRARARLPHEQREVVVELPVGDLVGRLLDQPADARGRGSRSRRCTSRRIASARPSRGRSRWARGRPRASRSRSGGSTAGSVRPSSGMASTSTAPSESVSVRVLAIALGPPVVCGPIVEGGLGGRPLGSPTWRSHLRPTAPSRAGRPTGSPARCGCA